MSATRITVGGADPYPVVVGTGVLGELASLVGAARTVVVIHPEGLEAIARPVCGVLAEAGYLVHAEPVPPGEGAKQIAVTPCAASRDHRCAATAICFAPSPGGTGSACTR